MDSTIINLKVDERRLKKLINNMKKPGEEEVSLVELSNAIRRKTLNLNDREAAFIEPINMFINDEKTSFGYVIVSNFDYLTDDLYLLFDGRPRYKAIFHREEETGRINLVNYDSDFYNEVYKYVKTDVDEIFDYADTVRDFKTMYERIDSDDRMFSLIYNDSSYYLSVDDAKLVLQAKHASPKNIVINSQYDRIKLRDAIKLTNTLSFQKQDIPECLHNEIDNEVEYRDKTKVYKKVLSFFK